MINYLIRKELLQIRRNGFLPKLVVVFPIVIMCVMPWVMNMEVKNIGVCIVDTDRNTESQRLVHRLEASNCFVFKENFYIYRFFFCLENRDFFFHNYI